ncbi:MAG: glycosyltransferase family 4 protein [Bellilinea sp.]
MNIGIVSTWFERGAAYVSKAYLQTLSRSHKVFIYARGGEKFGKGDPNWDSSNVHWGKIYKSRIPSYIDWPDFEKWVDQNQLQLLIFNEQISWDIILKCHYRLKIPIGSYIDYYKKDTVQFFKYYDFLLCNTERHYSVFRWHENAIFIPWGTDTELLTPPNPPNLSNGQKDITFFHSCGMSPYRKGTDLVVEAFKHLPGAQILIIHAQSKDRIDAVLRKEIESDDRIKLIEDEIPLPGVYHLGDIYVYPSRLDGIGLTIAEAMACGLPVITTNEPPMNEFVKDGFNGKVVKVNNYKNRYDNYYWPESECDVADLANAMNYYLVNSDQLPIHKKNARIYAEKYLNWNTNSISLNDTVFTIKKNENKISWLILFKIILNEYTFLNYPPTFLVTIIKTLGLGKILFMIKKIFHRV